MVSIDHFRRELSTQLDRATAQNFADVFITSGDLDRSVVGYPTPEALIFVDGPGINDVALETGSRLDRALGEDAGGPSNEIVGGGRGGDVFFNLICGLAACKLGAGQAKE